MVGRADPDRFDVLVVIKHLAVVRVGTHLRKLIFDLLKATFAAVGQVYIRDGYDVFIHARSDPGPGTSADADHGVIQFLIGRIGARRPRCQGNGDAGKGAVAEKLATVDLTTHSSSL